MSTINIMNVFKDPVFTSRELKMEL